MLVRRILSSFAFLAAAALPALLAACPGSGGDDPGSQQASLVVGVQAEDFGGLVQAVHIVASVDGKVADDETITIGAAPGAPGAVGTLPKEILLQGATGARAEVVVEALTSQAGTRGAGPTTPVVVRRAAAHLVPAAKKLLRVQLETRCVTFTAPGSTLPPAPTCDAPQTCALGRCVTEEVSFDQLEDYETSWATSPPDVCRPANHGPPEVIIGTGQTDFAPLADGQTLMLEQGPQGGHHLWIAVRMRNLRQSGSPTTLSAKLVDDPTSPIRARRLRVHVRPRRGKLLQAVRPALPARQWGDGSRCRLQAFPRQEGRGHRRGHRHHEGDGLVDEDDPDRRQAPLLRRHHHHVQLT